MVNLEQTQLDSIISSINNRAKITSPSLTGIPTAPTAVAGTNTAQIATTAFVLANVPSASLVSYKFSATEGQTTFVTNGATLSADPLVYCNGVLQDLTTTYTVLNKTVTFLDARTVNEKIVIVG